MKQIPKLEIEEARERAVKRRHEMKIKLKMLPLTRTLLSNIKRVTKEKLLRLPPTYDPIKELKRRASFKRIKCRDLVRYEIRSKEFFFGPISAMREEQLHEFDLFLCSKITELLNSLTY